MWWCTKQHFPVGSLKWIKNSKTWFGTQEKWIKLGVQCYLFLKTEHFHYWILSKSYIFQSWTSYFQLWILFIFIFLFYVLFKFIYLLLSKRDLKPSVSSVFNFISPCGSPIIFHVYNSYLEVQQINHETENWNVNMPTDFMIPVIKEH